MRIPTKFDFSTKSGEFPIDIIKEEIEGINKQLKGIVKISVEEYDGPVESYDKMNALAALASNLYGNTHVDIQDELGELVEEDFKYEIIITSDYLEFYKYRLMFLRNGLSGYPAEIILDKDVSDEINKNVDEDYHYFIDSESGFRAAIKSIFLTRRVSEVIQNIIYAVQRTEEYKKVNTKTKNNET